MRKSVKHIITIVAIVLVACAGIILVGNLSKGFQNLNPAKWELREVNDENLYQAMTIAADDDGYLARGENGLTVSVDEDNVIKCKGTAEVNDTIMVGTYKLEAGKSYVFDSNIKGSKGSVYLRLVDTANDAELKSCYNTAVVIPADELVTDINVRLEIVVVEDTGLNNLKIKPVLCIGTSVDDLVDFYK